MDAFMILELDVHSLSGIQGRCYESEAFEVSEEELKMFDRNFTDRMK